MDLQNCGILFVNESTGQLGLTHETCTEEGKEDDSHEKTEAFIRGPTITATHDVRHIRVELFDEVKAFSDSIDDRINVFAILESECQSFSKKLLDYR